MYWSSSSTFLRISSFSDGTGLSELVGVWVREAFRDDFLVRGDWSILCFQLSSRFMDSSLPTGSPPFLLLSSDSPLRVLLRYSLCRVFWGARRALALRLKSPGEESSSNLPVFGPSTRHTDIGRGSEKDLLVAGMFW